MTPEMACMNYAYAVLAVRTQTRIMRENPCEITSSIEAEYRAALESRPSNAGILVHPEGQREDCIALHWQVDTGPALNFVETPHMAFEDMCASCMVRYQAIMQRKEARKRLGAAKRSIEVVGKRLITPEAR